MEQFSEEHAKILLNKEWLVQVDNQSSTPYLIKFSSSAVDSTCFVLITDTKSTWTEVLNGKQFARRWRDCNKLEITTVSQEEEDIWRNTGLKCLSDAHTIGAMADVTFEVVESNYADFAFELEFDNFKWRWETCLLGHRLSAEILSRHLIMPLISTNYLAFSSADSVAAITNDDLQKAVDKIGRTARRTYDTHVKHAVSRPRFATTLRRMTAMCNFISDLPEVMSIAERPDLIVPNERATRELKADSPIMSRSVSPLPTQSNRGTLNLHTGQAAAPLSGKLLSSVPNTDSATESDDENTASSPRLKGKEKVVLDAATSSTGGEGSPRRDAAPSPRGTRSARDREQVPVLDSDSSPPRPAKKIRPQASTDEDSGEDHKRRVAQLKSAAGAGGVKRGTRQPIKRGGKRF